MRNVAGRVLVWAVAALALFASGACTHKSANPRAPATTSSPHSKDYTAAVNELQEFLNTWQRSGLRAAAEKYWVSDCGGECDLVLLRGKIVSYTPQSWVSGDRFTLLVKLNLQFSGSSGSFSEGANDRFATFVRASKDESYRFELNSGP
jgi:hypothetical protein